MGIAFAAHVGKPYGFSKRPLWLLKFPPNVGMNYLRASSRKLNKEKLTYGFFSIPTYCHFLDMDMDDISYGDVFIKLEDTAS